MTTLEPIAPDKFTAGDFKSDLKPIWCPGCGDYGVVAALTRALAAIGRPPHEIAFVSGIGCSSRIPGYTTAYGFNTVHGRALPIAQGIKLANPELLVLVASGDGDGFSIGGGHVPHVIRRNIDLTYIVMDNQIYGLTKGQLSPTSHRFFCGARDAGGHGGIGAADRRGHSFSGICIYQRAVAVCHLRRGGTATQGTQGHDSEFGITRSRSNRPRPCDGTGARIWDEALYGGIISQPESSAHLRPGRDGAT